MVSEDAARLGAARPEGPGERESRPANLDPDGDDIFGLREMTEPYRRRSPPAGEEARTHARESDFGEMETEPIGEGRDDRQTQLSRAIEDISKDGEPTNTQRGIKAHAHAKQQGKIVSPAHEYAELRKAALYDLGKLVTIDEVLRACKLNKVQVASEQLSASDLVQHLLQLISGWSARCLNNKIAVLRRFQGYLEQHSPGATIHDEISAVTMNKFFLWVHQQASDKAPDFLGDRDGTRSAKGAYDSLLFFLLNWGF
jgi:hypothetical protein